MSTRMEPAVSHDLVSGVRLPIPLRPVQPERGRAAVAPVLNLPKPLTTFIGRDSDVAAAHALLIDDGARLLTLTGPGGVGKTRLALRVASAVAASFSDGVVFVPLASITGPELALSAIARSFGLHETGAQLVADLLVNHLRDRQVLLILDNVEQVIGVAPLVAALLNDCQRLTVLATSRTRLHVSGEHRVPVSALALPEATPPGGDLPLAAVAASPAVQLFVDRAQEVDPRFIFGEGNARDVADICHRLDGLPLAIELAAVRMQLLTPAELLAHLTPALPLLTDGPTDAPDRLRTMRDAIAWSYELLTPAAQDLLRRLSIFVGGFTLEAAEYVSEVPPPQAPLRWRGESPPQAPERSVSPSVLETVAALVDASLLQRAEMNGETRLTVLETIREFAFERLGESGERDAIAARHAAWCARLAETVRRSGALSRREGLDRLECEHPNFRAALAWLLANGDGESALHLAAELAEFWFRRGHLAEGMIWLKRALDADTLPPTAARANALVGLSLLNWHQAARPREPRDLQPAAGRRDGFSQVMHLLHEAEAVARAAQDAGALAYARLHQGYVAFYRGDFDLAEARGNEGLETAAAIPQGLSQNGVYWLLAEVALARGDDPLAADRFTRLLQLARAGGDDISLANALCGLALLAERRGEPGVALRGFAEAVSVCLSAGNRLHAGRVLDQAACVAASAGHVTPAVRFIASGDALRFLADIGAVGFEPHLEHVLMLARATLGDEPFSAHWAAGAALTLDQAIAEIQRLADQIIATAPTEQSTGPVHQRMQERAEELVSSAHAVPRVAEEQSTHEDWLAPVRLTTREHDVLLLMADGVGDKAIAATLGIARRTASQHVAAILGKFGAASRTAAVSIALRLGLLEATPAETLLNPNVPAAISVVLPIASGETRA